MLAAYIAADVLWPSYVAIILPGLPYITPSRIILTLLAIGWIGAIARSPSVVETLSHRLRALRWIAIPLVAIIALKLLAIPFSPYRALAIKCLANQSITWYLPFLLTASLLRSRDDLLRGARVFVVAASIVGVLVVWERVTHTNPYVATLGQLVTANERWIPSTFTREFRRGGYRAFGPYTACLSLAELMTVCLPFALYWYEYARSRYARGALAASVLLMLFGTFAADSRTGMLTSGFILSLYLLIRVGRLAARDPRPARRRLIMTGVVLCVVAMVATGLYAMRQLDWEDAFGANGSRTRQLQLARPLLRDRPLIGYGPGNGVAALMLQYRPNGFDLTIDSYYLTAALETGFPGLIVLLILLGAFVCLAYKRAFEDRPDASLYLALALFGTAFALVRTTLSQDQNMNLFYIVLGAFVALNAMPEPAAPAASLTPRP